MFDVSNLKYFLPSWGMYLIILGGLGLTLGVQAAGYEANQSWATTWEGTCTGSWEEQPKEDPEDEEEKVVSALMITCPSHEKFKATKDFTIDYYRAQVQTVNCVQALGSFSNRYKWDCTIGETTT